jgi:uncharacterized protein YjiK
MALLAAILLALTAAQGDARVDLSLVFLERSSPYEAEGLAEPSALALSHGRKALWTVSDDTLTIFKVKRDGRVTLEDSFPLPTKEGEGTPPWRGLEGMTLSADGRYFLLVSEDQESIVKVHRDSQRIVAVAALRELVGYERLADSFEQSADRGLEGITLRPEDGNVFVLKQGPPGLLIELDPDLNSVRSYQSLGPEQGFLDDDREAVEIDYSGISYDLKRKQFWIASDRAKRVYLYDAKLRRVVQSFALGYGHEGEYRQIKAAEGVAFDATEDLLYVMCEEQRRVFTFQVR